MSLVWAQGQVHFSSIFTQLYFFNISTVGGATKTYRILLLASSNVTDFEIFFSKINWLPEQQTLINFLAFLMNFLGGKEKNSPVLFQTKKKFDFLKLGELFGRDWKHFLRSTIVYFHLIEKCFLQIHSLCFYRLRF